MAGFFLIQDEFGPSACNLGGHAWNFTLELAPPPPGKVAFLFVHGMKVFNAASGGLLGRLKLIKLAG